MINYAVREIMKATKVLDEKAQCTRCNWRWVPRTTNPIACPHCKSYEWKGVNLNPNSETKKAIKEARAGKGLTRSRNTKELFENLNM